MISCRRSSSSYPSEFLQFIDRLLTECQIIVVCGVLSLGAITLVFGIILVNKLVSSPLMSPLT